MTECCWIFIGTAEPRPFKSVLLLTAEHAEMATSTDPAGNMTTYSYLDSFYNDNG